MSDHFDSEDEQYHEAVEKGKRRTILGVHSLGDTFTVYFSGGQEAIIPMKDIRYDGGKPFDSKHDKLCAATSGPWSVILLTTFAEIEVPWDFCQHYIKES